MKKVMNKMAVVALAAAAMAIVSTPELRAETRVTGTTVTASITIAASTNPLITQLKNISNDANAASVAFPSFSGPQSSWSLVASQYMQVNVNNNSLAWRLRVYSNNFTSQPSTTTWGFQYGGMIGNVAGTKIGMAWLTNPTIIGAPGPNPASPTGITDPANSSLHGWSYLKDARDVDDPVAAGDSSFSAADGAGYTNIAFGSPGETRIVRPNVGGSEALGTPASAFYLYFKGDVSNAAAATYNTNLVLDLFNL